MDGLYDHLSNINAMKLKKDIENEEYDTDSLLTDVPAKREIDGSESNIANMTRNHSEYPSLQQYVYLTKCMFDILSLFCL